MSYRHQQVVRIFLASPSVDTQEARKIVVAAVAAIQNEPSYRHLLLDLWRWDNKQRRIVCDRSHNPQHDIEHQIGNPGDCDLVIGLFACTMGGTLLDQPPFGHHPSGQLWHCSEWEVEQGLQSQRHRLAGDPTGVTRGVWVFHDTSRPSDVLSWPRDKRDAFLAEVDAVQDFVDRANQPGQPMREGKNLFASLDELDDLIRQGLRDWLSVEFPQQATPQSAPQEPVTTCRDRELTYLGNLLHRTLQDVEALYIEVEGHQRRAATLERSRRTRVFRSDALSRMRVADGSCQEQVFGDVLDAYRALTGRPVRRLAVLGEPGAGKSFSLQRIACEYARRAMADPQAPIPLYIELGGWTRAQMLAGYIDSRLEMVFGGLRSDFERLREAGRAVLLLDGMNEIPPGQRADKVRQIDAEARDNRHASVLVSCRVRDFEGDCALPFDEVRLQPLTPAQIHAAIVRTMAHDRGQQNGLEAAEQLFWHLAAGDHADVSQLQAWWGVWQEAGLSLDEFCTRTDTPAAIKQSYRDGARRHLVADQRNLLKLAGNPYLLTLLMDIWVELGEIPANRAALFDECLQSLYKREKKTRDDRHDRTPDFADWRAALVAVAEALQRADGVAGDDGARTTLARADWPAKLNDELLAFARDASVLALVGEELRFTHQLLQESLAADVLLHASRSGQRSASDFWHEHYGWTRTGWEVVAEIAAEACAGDAAAQAGLIDWLAQTAPNVAADVWLHTGSPVLPAEQLARSKAQWLHRMTDIELEPHPAARAAIGRWLGVTGLDKRPGVDLRPDGLPDIAWVEFNDGLPFIYQDGEHPGLSPFALSRYLVTHRQFQAFVKADDGYREARWWQGFEDQQADASRPAEWPQPNCPRENVNWFEATAFCRWLSHRLGQAISLPNEHQWERAARGRDGWQYPSAAEDYPVGSANFNESSWEGCVILLRTSAVGLYPQGATREGGLLDMAGNVSEWCADPYDPDYEHQNSWRVLRGGSWGYSPEDMRASVRDDHHPDYGNGGIGFRVCRASPISEGPDAGATDR
ncbi:SUMF1/EgtB/PvdO family nonheme iron enzyme [Leptothrix ochracea]|uniref:SUMF1/EgtB/PvdO family nonheme iron enzyme n=1 Tax=Leptothrix ochracea TaxID=735331 RepID=UPI0034E25982